jgi:hypothetical protein
MSGDLTSCLVAAFAFVFAPWPFPLLLISAVCTPQFPLAPILHINIALVYLVITCLFFKVLLLLCMLLFGKRPSAYGTGIN